MRTLRSASVIVAFLGVLISQIYAKRSDWRGDNRMVNTNGQEPVRFMK